MSDGETLRVALQHQRSGRLDDAERGYQNQLERNPHDVNALHLLDTSRAVAVPTPSRSQERLPERALVLCSFNAPW